MKNPTSTRFLTGTILAIAAVLFLVLNFASGVLFKSFNLDLTDNNLYTLSAGSKEIIQDLSEPVVLRFYFSKKLAQPNPYLTSFASRVQDLLVQYQRKSKGKIIVEFIDPEPFSAEEDNAVNYGLQGVPVDNTGTELFMGLVGTNSVEVKKVIPFLQPGREANLEYDISQLIYNLGHPQRKLVGVISSLPIQGNKDARPWVVWQQMSQQFDMRTLSTNVDAIPDDINLLMIVNPATFSTDALKSIDKFVMRGGHLMAFVDPFTEVADPQTGKHKAHKDNIAEFNALLRSWGVRLDEDKVVSDRSLAKPVRIQNAGRDVTIRYPLWLDFSTKNFDKQDVLTASLDRITLASPGSLTKLDGAQTNFVPLIRTSADGMLVETSKIAEYQKNLDAFLRAYEPSGSYIVAARVSGPIKSAYSDAATPESNIVIVADADMLYDHFWLNFQTVGDQTVGVPNAGNGNFVLSTLDNLSGSNALISIRNRGAFTRPFETIQAIELKSQNKYRESEQVLQQKLEFTKQKLAQLEAQKKEGNTALLSVQQKHEEDAFRRELVDTRRELRDVRLKLNRDIEIVATGVKFFAIGLIPLVIIFGGLIFWGLRIQNDIRSRRAACSIRRP